MTVCFPISNAVLSINILFQGQFCGDGNFPLITASKENWDDRIVCYFYSLAPYSQNEGRFVPEDLDPSLCTHIIYTYALVIEVEGGWGIGPIEWKEDSLTMDIDWAEEMYTRFWKVYTRFYCKQNMVLTSMIYGA